MSSLPPIGDFDKGKSLRDAALNRLRTRRADLIRECTAAALRVALDRGEVCADDVRVVVPIPADISPKFVGVVFRDLADAGILRRAGFRNSTRPAAHARPLSLWRLADADADLAALIAAWSTLPDPIRAAIRALVGTVATVVTRIRKDGGPGTI